MVGSPCCEFPVPSLSITPLRIFQSGVPPVQLPMSTVHGRPLLANGVGVEAGVRVGVPASVVIGVSVDAVVGVIAGAVVGLLFVGVLLTEMVAVPVVMVCP